MNKSELITAAAEKAGLSKKDAEKAVNAVFDAITEALAKEEKIQLIGFGSFEVKERGERTGRNPQTGEEIKIPAAKTAVFKAGKGLKEAVGKTQKKGSKSKSKGSDLQAKGSKSKSKESDLPVKESKSKSKGSDSKAKETKTQAKGSKSKGKKTK